MMEASAARCLFCESSGQAVTATEAQALAHAAHVRPVHHEGIWTVRQDTGECGCECRLCYRDDECVCPLCTYDHDHSRRDAG